jgi:hypothetical protein
MLLKIVMLPELLHTIKAEDAAHFLKRIQFCSLKEAITIPWKAYVWQVPYLEGEPIHGGLAFDFISGGVWLISPHGCAMGPCVELPL